MPDEPLYSKLKEGILPSINQQEKQVRDSLDNRWVRCETCGKVDTDGSFCIYGGKGHINLGICRKCLKSSTFEQSGKTPDKKENGVKIREPPGYVQLKLWPD